MDWQETLSNVRGMGHKEAWYYIHLSQDKKKEIITEVRDYIS